MTYVSIQSGAVTRGYGLLEGFLARKRAEMADRLIPAAHRRGRILDIGCGCEPYFLARTAFATKIGLDKIVDSSRGGNGRCSTMHLLPFDINVSDQLPLPSESLDVVTMLAVFEHIRADRLINLVNEIERVLKSDGVYIITTPAGWTGPILTCMKWLRLVSPVEIDEHEDAYSWAKIRSLLQHTRLADHPTRFGSFEFFMNTWVVVTKSADRMRDALGACLQGGTQSNPQHSRALGRRDQARRVRRSPGRSRRRRHHEDGQLHQSLAADRLRPDPPASALPGAGPHAAEE